LKELNSYDLILLIEDQIGVKFKKIIIIIIFTEI